jgi:hypothetical protein
VDASGPFQAYGDDPYALVRAALDARALSRSRGWFGVRARAVHLIRLVVVAELRDEDPEAAIDAPSHVAAKVVAGDIEPRFGAFLAQLCRELGERWR